MRRLQAFEFCERTATPDVIREGIVELLGNGLRLSPVFEKAAPIFYEFCKRAGAQIILDLGSGSGEPCALLMEALKRRQLPPPNFIISDLIPNISKMEEVTCKFPEKLTIIRKPLDATNVPDNINHQARTVFNTFHHFPPPLAEKILADAVAKRKAFLILEAFPRNFLNFAGMFPFLHKAYIKSFFQKKNSTSRTLEYLLFAPFIALCGLWDACISIRRTYNQEELLAMVKPLGDSYIWEYHEIPFNKYGAVIIFFGIPETSSA